MWIAFTLIGIKNQKSPNYVYEYLYKLCWLQRQNMKIILNLSTHYLLYIAWTLLIIVILNFVGAMMSTKLVVKNQLGMLNSLQDLLQSNKKPLWSKNSIDLWQFENKVNDVYTKVYKVAVKHGIQKCTFEGNLLVSI